MAGKLTDNERDLAASLFEIWDDRDFVLGVVLTIQGEKEVQQMSDYVDSGEWDSPSDITVKALQLSRDRIEA